MAQCHKMSASKVNQGASTSRSMQDTLAKSANQPQLHGAEIQKNSTAEGMRSKPDEVVSVEDLQSTINKVCSRQIDLQHKSNEIKQKKLELQRLHDQLKKKMLNCQLDIEQISDQLDAEVKGRELLRTKVRHSCTVVACLQQHCESVNLSLSQLLAVKNDLMNESNQHIDTFTNLMEDNTQLMQSQAQQIQNLKSEILKEKKINQSMAGTFQSQSEYLKSEHQTQMFTMSKNISEMQKIQNLESQLASKKLKFEEAQTNAQKLSDQENQDIHDLSNKEIHDEKKCSTLIENLNHICEENTSLSAKSIELKEEVKTQNERLAKIAVEKMQLEKLREGFNYSLAKAEVVEKNCTENLQKLCLVNLEMETQIKELRIQMETSKCESTNQILEHEEKLECIKSATSNHNALLTQKVNETFRNCSMKSEKCESMKEKLFILQSQLKDMQNIKESALSLHESLESQSTKMLAEKQSLSCEIQKMADNINIERQKQLEIASSFREEKEQAEKEKIVIVDKMEIINKNMLSATTALTSKKSDRDLLVEKLEQMRNESKKMEESSNDRYCSIVGDYQNKIALLTKQKELTTQNNQSIVLELQDKLEDNNFRLNEVKAKALDARNKYEKIAEELASHSIARINIQQEIEERITGMNELTDKSILCERDLHIQKSKLNELSSSLEEEGKKRQGKLNKMAELQHQIKSIEKCKADTTAENCDTMNEILSNIWKSKQACESLSSTTSELNGKLDELKQAHNLVIREYGDVQKSAAEFDKQCEIWEKEANRLKIELENVERNYDKAQRRVKTFKQEAVSSNQIYQALYKGILASKARRRNQLRANLPEKLAPSMKAKVSVVSVEVSDNKHTTSHSDNKQTTPRSILKSPKAATPQSEKLQKRVSFIEDNGAGSASSVNSPEELDEIVKNPAAEAQITVKKI